MIRPKNETKFLLLLKTKNCETLFKQTHRKPKEMVELKLTKPRDIFSFNPSILISLDING